MRQERIEADYVTVPAQNATGGAILSTRDTVTFGFGLEQVDEDHALRAAQAQPELPGPDHGRHRRLRRSSASSGPLANSTATPADPIEVDVTAFDDRGDLKTGQPPTPTARWVGFGPGVPAPVPLHAAEVQGRQAPVKLHRRGGGQGRQQVRPATCMVNVPRHRRPGALAGAGQQADALGLRRSSGRRFFVRQRRLPQRPALVLVRMAAQRLRDRRRHR